MSTDAMTGREAIAAIKEIQEERGYDPHRAVIEARQRRDIGFESLVSEYAKENKCSKGKAMMACAKLYPDEHQDFINRTNPK